MKTVIAVAIAVTAFLGLVGPSDTHANECGSLKLNVTYPYYFNKVNCSSGHVDTIQQYYVHLSQDITGPITCQIRVEAKEGPSVTSGFRVQQNNCFLKSGNITLTYEYGDQPVYTSSEGSWSDHRAGEISFTSFIPR